MIKSHSYYLASFALLLCLYGCQRHARIFPAISGEKLASTEAAAFITRVAEASTQLDSFRALSSSRLVVGSERNRLRHVVAFDLPGKLRFESLPLNGAYTLSLLVANASGVTLLDPLNQEAYSSASGEALIARLLKVPLNETELSHLLVGRLAERSLDALRVGTDIAVFEDNVRGSVFIKLRDFEALYEFGLQDALLRSFSIRDRFADKVALEVEYKSYQTINGVMVPAGLIVRVPRHDFQLEFEFSAIAINPQLKTELFTTKIPKNFTAHQVQ